MKRILMIAVLMLGLALVVAACGGGDDDDETTAEQTAAEAEAPAEDSDDEVAETSAEEPRDATTPAETTPGANAGYCTGLAGVRRDLEKLERLTTELEDEPGVRAPGGYLLVMARLALTAPELKSATDELKALTPPKKAAAAHNRSVKLLNQELAVHEETFRRLVALQQAGDGTAIVIGEGELRALSADLLAAEKASAEAYESAC